MKVTFKAPGRLWDAIRSDLRRPHAFAAERVGFIAAKAMHSPDCVSVIGQSYHPVADKDYINDPSVGAMMGQEAIRKALEIALLESSAMFHVHVHDHSGEPSFSRTDIREQVKFVPDFFKVRPQMPHGAVVLSEDNAAGNIWLRPDFAVPIAEFVSVAPQVKIWISRPWLKLLFQPTDSTQ